MIMEPTAIQQELPKKATETAFQTGMPPGTPEPRPSVPKHPAAVCLGYLADLRITVTLFALSMLLVFWGTLAQTDNGVWTVVRVYFRSIVAWVPMKVILFNSLDEPGMQIPFPGGTLLGFAMLINLLAAHAVRFKLSWNRGGIFLIHVGIIVMMLGEFITGLYAVEGNMIINIGSTQNTVIHPTQSEMAVMRTINDKKDEVISVPAHMLVRDADIENAELPFKIHVNDYMANSSISHMPGNKLADKGFGRSQIAKSVPEVSGVDPNQKHDAPSVYVKLSDLKGKALGTWLLSAHFDHPQFVTVDGKNYQLLLRFKQTTRPYSIRLNQFEHKVFPGTRTPKDFHSYITLIDPNDNLERTEEIYMNHPLYYQGETFYQSSWTTDVKGEPTGTVLQVVQNPGWLLPYISCAIVGFGLLIHFGLTLYRFANRERRTVR